MPLFITNCRSQVTVQLFCLVLLNGLLHVQHLYPNRLFPEPDLDHVPVLTFREALAGLSFTRTRPASQASLATVLRLIRRETFKNLSSLMD